MRRQFAWAALLLGGVSLLAAIPAAGKPDFSGTWKMDAEKSDLGGAPEQEALVYTVEHKDPKLKIVISSKNRPGEERNFTIGGDDVNKSSHGEMRSKSHWDGAVLVFDTKGKYDGYEVQMLEKWSLSVDGKVMTITREISSNAGDLTQTYIMLK